MFGNTVRRILRFAIVGQIACASAALAAEPLKIGVILPFTGPYAIYGTKILNGAKLYLSQHGGRIGDREVELVTADDTGVAPELSKRLAQQLLIKDKVSFLVGFGLTPSALTVAPLATQAKVPMIVMNASTTGLTRKSPFIIRVSQTQPQVTEPMAKWAIENGVRKVYTLVADYSPGHDSEKQFTETFTKAGGEIVGSVRYPLNNADPSPYLEKIKDANPQAVFVFLPPGELSIAFIKGFKSRGLEAAGMKLFGTSLTEEAVIDATGDAAIGVITASNYSEPHRSPENDAYVAAYRKAYGEDRPNYMSVAGYDGIALIARVAETKGTVVTGQAFMDAVKGISWASPRGPVQIDPETRDIVQSVYIRKTEKVDGRLENVEFATYPGVRDPQDR